MLQNLFGMAMGPLIGGVLSDAFGLQATLAVTPLFGIAAAWLLVIGSRTYERDVERAFLRFLEDVVVLVPLMPDLRRHAVEPLWNVLRAGESPIRDCARNAAIAVIERMNGHEPQMRERRLQHGLGGRVAVEPVEKTGHLSFEPRRGGGLEVHALATHGA